MLHCEAITKRYTPDGPAVLDGVSFSLQPGQSAAILGPSGSGKSTLLNIVAGLDVPDSGVVRWGDVAISEQPEAARAAGRAEQLGMIFQKHHLLGHLTVLENVLLPLLARGKASKADSSAAMELIQAVGLADQAEQLAGTLSVGQAQRAAVARAGIASPSLLLADEPTGSLDHATAEQVADLLLEFNARLGATLLVVTHWEELAARMDRTFRLQDGGIEEKNQ